MKKKFLLVLFFLLSYQSAFAEDLVMSVNQSTYYFTIGENAIIPMEIENNYGEPISGLLQYIITQQIIQGNTQVSSSNSNTSTLTINDGKQKLSLDFGTGDSPSTLIANLNFSYDDGTAKNVILGPIEINFVLDESQKNNTANQMQSSTQQGISNQNNQPNPQQSLQQRLDDILNQSPLNQDPQQRLQNNQLPQDSSALKQEIQEQLKKENKIQAEFEKQIISNEEFQKLHQQMVNQGYNLTKGRLNPTSNSTGTFEANYENQEGKWGKIQGNMQNGTLTDIQKQIQEEQESLLSKLRQDSTFQEYEKQLVREGFVEQNFELEKSTNKTSILLEYQNEEFQTATIRAEFENKELVSIDLQKPGENYLELISLLIILLVGSIALFLYFKLKPKKPISIKPIIEQVPQKKIDYLLESTKLLEEAKENFKEQQFKDAYGKISQAVRLYLSYQLNIKKEITNEDLLQSLKETTYPIHEIEKCFNFSSLVEFAKSPPNEQEFQKMIIFVESLLKSNSKST
jgi:hypothetical protein